jgi:hypothetical protein
MRLAGGSIPPPGLHESDEMEDLGREAKDHALESTGEDGPDSERDLARLEGGCDGGGMPGTHPRAVSPREGSDMQPPAPPDLGGEADLEEGPGARGEDDWTDAGTEDEDEQDLFELVSIEVRTFVHNLSSGTYTAESIYNQVMDECPAMEDLVHEDEEALRTMGEAFCHSVEILVQQGYLEYNGRNEQGEPLLRRTARKLLERRRERCDSDST